jgi:hypothetical protein
MVITDSRPFTRTTVTQGRLVTDVVFTDVVMTRGRSRARQLLTPGTFASAC